jgi:hypothetical protein
VLARAAIDHASEHVNDTELSFRVPRQELALIEARLANFSQARQLLEACFQQLRRYQSPLALGSLHRDSAIVAALACDADAFAEHLGAMESWFRPTENPWLIQQCDKLRLHGALEGLLGGAAPLPNSEPADMDGSTVLWIGDSPANNDSELAVTHHARGTAKRAKR